MVEKEIAVIPQIQVGDLALNTDFACAILAPHICFIGSSIKGSRGFHTFLIGRDWVGSYARSFTDFGMTRAESVAQTRCSLDQQST